jgi:hypothetical protein
MYKGTKGTPPTRQLHVECLPRTQGLCPPIDRVPRHKGGTDLLGDTTGFSLLDAGAADVVQDLQRGCRNADN